MIESLSIKMNKDEEEEKEERDSLEHRVGPKLVEHGGVGDPEQPVDYVNNPVGGGDVGGNDGGVHAAAFDGDGLVSSRALHHVEVELLPVGGGRYLQEFVRKLCKGIRECSQRDVATRDSRLPPESRALL